MHRAAISNAAILLALAQACSLALAQASAERNAPAAAGSSGATFECGGVGVGEQQRMKAAASDYHLMLTFAVSNGAYLSDVDVEIKDAKGRTVLSTKCDGPIMLVRLPSGGSWRITAQANGQSRQKTITAGSGRVVQATFVWPAGA
jgi:hypothetical protein